LAPLLCEDVAFWLLLLSDDEQNTRTVCSEYLYVVLLVCDCWLEESSACRA
jgi:hypothetical protein